MITMHLKDLETKILHLKKTDGLIIKFEDNQEYMISSSEFMALVVSLRQSDLGSRSSEKKKISSASNGKLGGRPKKVVAR